MRNGKENQSSSQNSKQVKRPPANVPAAVAGEGISRKPQAEPRSGLKGRPLSGAAKRKAVGNLKQSTLNFAPKKPKQAAPADARPQPATAAAVAQGDTDSDLIVVD